MSSVLVVEDDADISETIKNILEDEGHTVVTVNDGEDALATMATAQFDIVFLDIMLPHVSGKDVLALARHVNPEARIVVLTALDRYQANSIHNLNGVEVIRKPFDISELLDLADHPDNGVALPAGDVRPAVEKERLHGEGT